ncbi:MAG TPA: CoA transferase [Caulobacteraceae bacterium]|jgi:crotonobetainyl-CoA:carnitine CoA-transferase CaiB-like acyl-CoA transferase
MTAFQGVRVLDCTQGLAGPLASMLLADFGAQVLKVEPPGGDRARSDPGYLMWNRNKVRTTLDLETERARLDELLAAADVAVFDHTPKTLERLGLRAEDLAERFPRLIHLWTPGFGTTGPWSELPTHHGLLTGLTGAAWRQGSYADQPVWYVAQIIHHAQGVLAASAVGAALIQRGANGAGRAVTVSGLHGMAQTACPITMAGSPGRGPGKPLGGGASYRLYQCGDGKWFFMGTLFAHFFQRALEALELEDGPDRLDVAAAIQRKLMTQPRAYWVERFRAHDVPIGTVESRGDLMASEVIRANDLAATVDDPEYGQVEMVGVPARLYGTPGAVRHLIRDAADADIGAFTAPRPEPGVLEVHEGPPLAGIKVLDLGSVIAGAYATAILANLGADVVKIEGMEGDPFRGGGFVNYNRGKRGLGLDLKVDEGREAFFDMARQADAVLDNYRLGVRRRLGVDYAALAEVNPRIVSCSINTYGTKGSDAHQPGFDGVMQARSGLMQSQGGEGNEPVYHSVAINDVATAAMGAFTVIAGLHARTLTGAGQDTETSLAAQGALYQSGDLVSYAGRPAPHDGCRDCLGFGALERYYQCTDGWLTLVCRDAAEYTAVARTLGHPEWLARWDAETALAEPRDGALAGEIAEAIKGRKRDETAAALLAAGAPSAPVLGSFEAQHTEYFWENSYYHLRNHPEMGQVITGRGFANFDGMPLSYDRMEPELGEDSAEVLSEYGFPHERIVELARNRVIFRG